MRGNWNGFKRGGGGGGVGLEMNIGNFFRGFGYKGSREIAQWLEGENGVQRQFLFLRQNNNTHNWNDPVKHEKLIQETGELLK